MAYLKSKIFIIQIICLLFSHGALASGGEEFCQTYLEIQKTTHQKMSLKEGLKLTLFPSTIIHPVELKQENESSDSVIGEKYIFVHLPERKFDPQKIEEMKIREKELSKLDLFQKLKFIQDRESCLSLLIHHGDDFKKVEDYFDFYLKNQDQIEAYGEEKSLKVLRKKLKTFQRKGWGVYFVDHVSEMYQKLHASSKISDLFIIAHSDKFGRLYDAHKNTFPKGAFANLPKSLKRLVIYSCHSEKVLDFYKIKSNLHKYSVYYPQVEESFKSLFESKTPLVSIRSFKDISPKKSFISLNSIPRCELKITNDQKLNSMAVSLNDQFLGLINLSRGPRLDFDCDLLRPEKNQFKFFDMDQSARGSLGEWEAVLKNKQGERKKINLKEYLSWDQQKHLLTIGHEGEIYEKEMD